MKLLEAHGGSVSTLTRNLAKLGSSGEYPNNIERDLYRVLHLPIAPYYVVLRRRCLSNREDIELKRIPLLLPHELYHYMFEPCREVDRYVRIVSYIGRPSPMSMSFILK